MSGNSAVFSSFCLMFAVGCAGSPAVEEEHAPPPTTTKLEPFECGTVTRMHTLNDVFLASQPKPADIEQAQKGGIRTIINLRHASEMEFDEAAAVAAQGMNYVELPWNGADELTDAVFDRGRELLNTAEKPIMMHCSSANRVGALWFVWRAVDGGVAVEAAEQEAEVVGTKTPAYKAKARDYIARHANSR